MTFDEFKQLVSAPEQPAQSLSEPLQALWHDKNQDFDKAHQIVQNSSGADSAWVHAYLHRKEGDRNNARYWYNQAGQPESQAELSQEWEQIARSLLEKI